MERRKFAEPAIDLIRRPDGAMLLFSSTPLGRCARSSGEWLEHWGEVEPQRSFLAERGPDGAWRRISYGLALQQARAIGQALIDRRLSAERPVMILSENGIDHALLMLGALHVGVPVVPVSTAYSRQSQDLGKLKHIAGVVTPGLVFARDGGAYGRALVLLAQTGAELVVAANPPAGLKTTSFDALLAEEGEGDVDDAFERVGPDTIAKILFTSGSTGQPKGVINTQRMMCANQEMIRQVWPLLTHRPPVIVDWLPWSHTFGSNHNFNMMLCHGGALYIDEGKPAPGLIDRTVANLKEIAPTLFFNVPRGYGMLLDRLETDEALRRNFFRDLDFLFYAAAALPQSLWERLERLARQERGAALPLVSAWGLTETAPAATAVHFPNDRAGNIGVPLPGTELKLIPEGGKLAVRVRGPNVTPGYWRAADLTAASFDEEGFYLTGDAARLVDPADPDRGLLFDGRLSENFKLSSGTWVNVGELRVAAIAACAPVAEDVVVTGHDRDEIGILIFPSLAGCRALCPHLPSDAGAAMLIAEPAVRSAVAHGLARLDTSAGGTSRRIARALLLAEPPSIDANEITDKGYLNQRAILERRAVLVARLHAPAPGDDVIVP